MNIELIATELEVSNNIFTGNFSTNNCTGVEKVKRIKEKYDLSSFNRIYAYGDSNGDKEMFCIATDKFFRRFF